MSNREQRRDGSKGEWTAGPQDGDVEMGSDGEGESQGREDGLAYLTLPALQTPNTTGDGGWTLVM